MGKRKREDDEISALHRVTAPKNIQWVSSWVEQMQAETVNLMFAAKKKRIQEEKEIFDARKKVHEYRRKVMFSPFRFVNTEKIPSIDASYPKLKAELIKDFEKVQKEGTKNVIPVNPEKQESVTKCLNKFLEMRKTNLSKNEEFHMSELYVSFIHLYLSETLTGLLLYDIEYQPLRELEAETLKKEKEIEWGNLIPKIYLLRFLHKLAPILEQVPIEQETLDWIAEETKKLLDWLETQI